MAERAHRHGHLNFLIGGKEAEAAPRLDIEAWGEVRCAVELADRAPGKGQMRSQASGRLNWRKGNIEVRFYSREGQGGTPRQEGPGAAMAKEAIPDGYEIEVVWEQPPPSNVIEFTLETEGLDWFYQPELTEEEVRKGCVRAPHVVGSYAVYHQIKTGDYTALGGQDYKCGKAFHLYRPLAEDALGDTCWCDLHVDVARGLLTITVPQDWLSRAVFPVRIDPTFGYTTAGASWGTSEPNCLVGVRATGAAGTGVSISAYYVPYAAGRGVLVEQSTKTIVPNGITASIERQGGPGWYTFGFVAGPSLSGIDYYICFIAGGFDQSGVWYDVASGAGFEDPSNSHNSPTNPTDGIVDDKRRSIYVTYVAGSTGHELTAAGLTTGAPVLVPPAVGQAHRLTPGDVVAGSPTCGAPALSHKYALEGTAVTTGTPALAQPDLAQRHALEAVEVATAAPACGTPALGQEQTLEAVGVTMGSPVCGVPALGQRHALDAPGLDAAAPALPCLELRQRHALATADLATPAPMLEAPALAEEGYLVPGSLSTQAPELGRPALGQKHVLETAGVLAGPPSVGAPALTKADVLQALGVSTAPPALGQPAAVQACPLETGALLTGPTALGRPRLGQAHRLQPAGVAMAAAILGAPRLVAAGELEPVPLFAGSPDLGRPGLHCPKALRKVEVRGVLRGPVGLAGAPGARRLTAVARGSIRLEGAIEQD